MAYLNNPKIQYADGKHPEIQYAYEADSQSFGVGEIVYRAGAAVQNVLTAYASDGTNILGIALAAATNVTSGHTQIPVEVIPIGAKLKIRVTASGTDTLSNTLYPGKAYGSYVASNVCYLDADETTTDVFIFEEALYDENGNATYWAIVRPIATRLQAGGVGI